MVNFDKALREVYNKASLEPIVIDNVGKRTISDDMWNDYISRIEDPVYKNIVETVRKNTIYVPWKDLVSNLILSYEKFLTEIGDKPFKILIETRKFSSQDIFILLLWNKIKDIKNFEGFITENSQLDNDEIILIIDDCIYSGHTTLGSIDVLTYNNPKVKFYFHIVIPYVYTENITRELDRFNLSGYTIHNVVDIYPIKEFRDMRRVLIKYGFEGTHLVPIYFDHKVGGRCSTFYKIYMEGYISEQESKQESKPENIGMLLPLAPYTDIKDILYKRYFKNIYNPPVNGK